MKINEIFQRIEEIEDYVAAAKMLDSPIGSSDIIWLCKKARKLIEVAEAAKEAVSLAKPLTFPPGEIPFRLVPFVHVERLAQALSSLESED